MDRFSSLPCNHCYRLLVQVLPLLDEALLLAQQQLCMEAVPDERTAMIPKLGVRARLMGLTLHRDGSQLACKLSPSLGSISSAHINQLLTVTGVVCKAGPIKALEVWRLYECQRCKHRYCCVVKVLGEVPSPHFTVWAELSQFHLCVGFRITPGLPCQRMWR